MSEDAVVFGLLRIGGLDVALPLSALREVVPCPAELTDLPVRAVGLLGVMTLRSALVPVVDPLPLIGREHERSHGQVVVVVAHGGRLVGLLADEIRGLATVQPEDFDEVGCAGVQLLFSRTFHHPDDGHVISVLDAPTLLALPGLPVVHERELAQTPTVTMSVGAGRDRSLTLVRCGVYSIAVDVAQVRTTIPSPVLSRSVVDGPTCLGMTPVAGFDVAVLDVLALLGLGSLAGTPLECGLVLDTPHGQVVLGVSSLTGLRDVPHDRVVALPAAASTAPDVLREVADVDGVGACLLVDGALLAATPAVVSLAKVGTESAVSPVAGVPSQPGGQARDRAGAVVGQRPFLAYRAGVDLATDLAQVAEVLACPEDLVPACAAPGVLGFVMHRGAAVPVVCLAELLGRKVVDLGPSSRLLLVEVDGEPVAFAVDALHAIVPKLWSDPSQRREDTHGDTTRLLKACLLVELAGRDGLVPELDLVALVRMLRSPVEEQVESLSWGSEEPAAAVGESEVGAALAQAG